MTESNDCSLSGDKNAQLMLDKMEWYYQELSKARIRKSIPKPTREAIWRKSYGSSLDGICTMCKQNLISVFRFHCAHVLAVVKGGTNDIDNLAPICDSCNLSMGDEHMHIFKTRSERALKILNGENPCGTQPVKTDIERIIQLEKSHAEAMSRMKFELYRAREEIRKLNSRLRDMPKKRMPQNLQNTCRYCGNICRQAVCKERLCQSQRNIDNQRRYNARKRKSDSI
jgi:hypothetical protein